MRGADLPHRSFVSGVPGAIMREVPRRRITGMRHMTREIVARAKLFRDCGLERRLAQTPGHRQYVLGQMLHNTDALLQPIHSKVVSQLADA